MNTYTEFITLKDCYHELEKKVKMLNKYSVSQDIEKNKFTCTTYEFRNCSLYYEESKEERYIIFTQFSDDGLRQNDLEIKYFREKLPPFQDYLSLTLNYYEEELRREAIDFDRTIEILQSIDTQLTYFTLDDKEIIYA